MEKVSITRKDLHKMVWKEPLLTLSKRYSISDNGLRKICIRLDIPLPPNGYWQKVRYGKSIPIRRLPSYAGEETIELYLRGENDGNVYPFISRHKQLKMEILIDMKMHLIVPDRLAKPDILVLEARECLKDDSRNHSWHNGIIRTREGYLDIRVSRANVSRALRFFDTFIKLMRARGHEVKIQYGKTCVIIYDVKIEISLKEKLKWVITPTDYSWVNRKYQPTGRLAFRVEDYNQKMWEDGKVAIENKLPDILAYLEIKAEKMLQERRYYQEQNKIREEKEQIEREIRERKERELRDFKELIRQANQWRLTQIIRDYIEHVEDEAKKSGDMQDELIAWLNWSKQKADWFDPYLKGQDFILLEEDRNKV